jgi:signal transduction histidine kinase
MFQKTYIKLAGFYLLIIMAISLFFSVNLYQISVRELDRNAMRQIGLVERIRIAVPGPVSRDDLIREHDWQVDEAKKNIAGRLYITNVIILVGGGMLSYYLARRTLRPIEEAHEAQSRFTADASHELRTPIAAMKTEIEVALMNPKLNLKEAKAKLSSNLEELERLTTLTEGLLRLAQLEHNDLIQESLQVSDAISDAIAMVTTQAEQKQIIINVTETCDAKVVGDRTALAEVFSVLLSNAVKYSPAKTEVVIEYEKHPKHIMVSILDSGQGISDVDLPYIFDRFYRADSSRSRQQSGGYGLGLAIAKQIVDLHKGTIKAANRQNRGSMFTVTLPRINSQS